MKGKGRTPKGTGDIIEPPNLIGVPTVVRGLGGSAPATPTEAETAIESTTGWNRNSLRGSKCNSYLIMLITQSQNQPFEFREF